MDDRIIRCCNSEVKVARNLIDANFRRLAQVILGVSAPAWTLESDELGRPIHDDRDDAHIDLVRTAEAGLRAIHKRRCELVASA